MTDRIPAFTIVIPTFNEADDIATTLDSLVALDYPDYEVLVIDESRDETPAIVQAYTASNPRVRYVRQSRFTGRAAGRNQGILDARGNVVVILNADVSLPRDFLSRLVPHYAAGADYVLVESAVSNTGDLFPRFVLASHANQYGNDTRVRMNWTEGFSCRRQAAIDAGLLPEGYAAADDRRAPLVAGEDGWFGERLEDLGYTKVFDREIVVTHVMPHKLRSFFRNRVGRGHGSVQIAVLRDGLGRSQLAAQTATVVLATVFGTLLVLPVLYRGWERARYSPRGLADWLPFTWAYIVESWANMLGHLHGFGEVLRTGMQPHAELTEA